jgi:hypothetical protein
VPIAGDKTSAATLVAPAAGKPSTLHVILVVTDSGAPPLTRYARIVLNGQP